MSIVKDLREALQEVIAPDLKAVVQGLGELRSDVREGNAQLRAELKEGIAQLRAEMRQGDDLLKTEIRAVETRAVERDDRAEKRLNDRFDSVLQAITIADLTRENAQLKTEVEQLRKAQPEQQH